MVWAIIGYDTPQTGYLLSFDYEASCYNDCPIRIMLSDPIMPFQFATWDWCGDIIVIYNKYR